MFLYYLLITLFVPAIVLMIMLILIQKSKGSLGMGSMGGGTQMIFGGSGGQDFFQKATWTLGAFFMATSLFLAVMKTKQVRTLSYAPAAKTAQLPTPAPQQAD